MLQGSPHSKLEPPPAQAGAQASEETPWHSWCCWGPAAQPLQAGQGWRRWCKAAWCSLGCPGLSRRQGLRARDLTEWPVPSASHHCYAYAWLVFQSGLLLCVSRTGKCLRNWAYYMEHNCSYIQAMHPQMIITDYKLYGIKTIFRRINKNRILLHSCHCTRHQMSMNYYICINSCIYVLSHCFLY